MAFPGIDDLRCSLVRDLNAALATHDGADLSAFLVTARENCKAVRANLAEVMLAQGFQDITGQILRGVHQRIGEVQAGLDDLMSANGLPREAILLDLHAPGGLGISP